MSRETPSSSPLGGWLTLLGIVLFIGYLAGRFMSPDWTDRVTVMKSMAANLRVEATESGDMLAMDCGVISYWYDPASDQLYREVAGESALADESIRLRGGLDATEKLAGLLFGSAVTETGAVKQAMGRTQNQRTTSRAAGLVAMVAFVGVGFYMGYDGAPDCDAADAVHRDQDVWRSFAQSRIAAAPAAVPAPAPSGWAGQPEPVAYPQPEYPQPQYSEPYPQPEQAEYDPWQYQAPVDTAAVAGPYYAEPYYAPEPQYP